MHGHTSYTLGGEKILGCVFRVPILKNATIDTHEVGVLVDLLKILSEF